MRTLLKVRVHHMAVMSKGPIEVLDTCDDVLDKNDVCLRTLLYPKADKCQKRTFISFYFLSPSIVAVPLEKDAPTQALSFLSCRTTFLPKT